MEKDSKDSKIIFLNKQVYEFNSKDLQKALAFCQGKPVWAIETPWGVLTVMDKEMYENVSQAVLDGFSEPSGGYSEEDI